MSLWETVSLDRCIACIRAGVSVLGEARLPRTDEVGILTLSAVSGGKFSQDACKALPASVAPKLGSSVRAGTLLMSRSNTADLVGSTVLVEEDHPDRFLPDLLWEITLRDDSPLTAAFLADYLATPAGRQLLKSAAMGTSGSMKKLSMKRLRMLGVPLVAHHVQDAWSQARRSYRLVLTTLETLLSAERELKRGLMHELLMGQRRFPKYETSDWIEMPLGELFSERNETNREGSSLLAVTGDRGVIPRDELDRRDTSSADKSKYKRVCPGDIAYNTMRMWQGVSGLSDYEGIVSPAYTVLVPRGPLSASYAKHLFKLPCTVHMFWRHSQGLVDDTLSLKYPNFARIRVRFPASLDEQMRIAGALDLLDRESACLETMKEAYAAQQRALMHPLLSGDLSIPAPAEPELARV